MTAPTSAPVRTAADLLTAIVAWAREQSAEAAKAAADLGPGIGDAEPALRAGTRGWHHGAKHMADGLLTFLADAGALDMPSALELSVQEADDARDRGWEAARTHYRRTAEEYIRDNWPLDIVDIALTDLDDIFAEPEDEAEVLRKAALSRGQP